jgi:hypothetical protein
MQPKNLREVMTCFDCKHFDLAYLGNPYDERCVKYMDFKPENRLFLSFVCDELEPKDDNK